MKLSAGLSSNDNLLSARLQNKIKNFQKKDVIYNTMSLEQTLQEEVEIDSDHEKTQNKRQVQKNKNGPFTKEGRQSQLRSSIKSDHTTKQKVSQVSGLNDSMRRNNSTLYREIAKSRVKQLRLTESRNKVMTPIYESQQNELQIQRMHTQKAMEYNYSISKSRQQLIQNLGFTLPSVNSQEHIKQSHKQNKTSYQTQVQLCKASPQVQQIQSNKSPQNQYQQIKLSPKNHKILNQRYDQSDSPQPLRLNSNSVSPKIQTTNQYIPPNHYQADSKQEYQCNQSPTVKLPIEPKIKTRVSFDQDLILAQSGLIQTSTQNPLNESHIRKRRVRKLKYLINQFVNQEGEQENQSRAPANAMLISSITKEDTFGLSKQDRTLSNNDKVQKVLPPIRTSNQYQESTQKIYLKRTSIQSYGEMRFNQQSPNSNAPTQSSQNISKSEIHPFSRKKYKRNTYHDLYKSNDMLMRKINNLDDRISPYRDNPLKISPKRSPVANNYQRLPSIKRQMGQGQNIVNDEQGQSPIQEQSRSNLNNSSLKLSNLNFPKTTRAQSNLNKHSMFQLDNQNQSKKRLQKLRYIQI